MPHRRHALLVIGVLSAVAAVSLAGCTPVQTAYGDRHQHMMISDIVPLAADEQPYERGHAMAVPQEPSRFELKRRQKPIAMKSDLENARLRTEKFEAKPREELKEPIP